MDRITDPYTITSFPPYSLREDVSSGIDLTRYLSPKNLIVGGLVAITLTLGSGRVMEGWKGMLKEIEEIQGTVGYNNSSPSKSVEEGCFVVSILKNPYLERNSEVREEQYCPSESQDYNINF